MKRNVAAFPITLRGQLYDKSRWYAAGAALIAIQQLLMAKRDFLVHDAVNAATELRGADARTGALTIFGVTLVAAVARVLSRIGIFSAGRNVEYELRAVLLDRLQKLGPAFFRTMPTGEIMSRSTNDLAQIRLLLGFGILNVISSVLAAISALYVMTSISIRLTLASLVSLPLLWAVTRSFSLKLFIRTKENQEAIGQMSDRVLASLAGARVVRSFGLLPAETRAFSENNDNYLQKSLALARLRGSMGPVMGSVTGVSILVVFWYGGVLLEQGLISAGDFVAFWMALQRLFWPLLALGFVTAIVQRGRAGYERVRGILQATPEIQSGGKRPAEPVRGAISVRNLRFAHEQKQILDGINFEVPKGSSLAILGRTGSGKSTIAALLPRLLATPSGSVFLDGDDVCDLPLDRVRSSIGYAQQDAFLFSTTVSKNIGYSLPDADGESAVEAVREAAHEAEVLSEIEALPEGFDTVVGERGVQLSGGQRQRVALARALLRDAPVLVLDDPLSAVDAKTEAAILEAIERQKKVRTVVLITHRVSAARRCDSIVVLDGGKVIEAGTHDELVAAGGLYAAFAREQDLEADLDALDVAASSGVRA